MTELVTGRVQSEPWWNEANFCISLTVAVGNKETRMLLYLSLDKNATTAKCVSNFKSANLNSSISELWN
jgi:hypothetical protein